MAKNEEKIQFVPFGLTPIYQQIVQFIIDKIERGIYKKDYHLLSINEFSKEFSVSRDTIERAYKI